MRIENRLCPYLLKELDSGFETDKEHVLPFALGAPKDFSISASKGENNRLNDAIDSPMLNDPMIRFLSVAAKIKSRSGPIETTISGSTAQGDTFNIFVSQDGAIPKFEHPIIKDQNGKVIGLRGFGKDQITNAVSEYVTNMQKRGKSVSFTSAHISADESLNASFHTELFRVYRGLVKIAYLTTVWAFGDHAITSKSGEIFRNAMGMASGAEMDLTQIKHDFIAPEFPEYLPLLKPNEHLLLTALTDRSVETYVKILGGIGMYFSTPRYDIDLQSGAGEAMMINATEARFKDVIIRSDEKSEEKPPK
jgi:hypothetical protein